MNTAEKNNADARCKNVENEIYELKVARYKSLENEILRLKAEQAIIKEQLKDYLIENVKREKYPGINPGDKVRVVYKTWDDEEKEGVYYFNDFTFSNLVGVEGVDYLENLLRLSLYPLKKDNKPSAREVRLANVCVVSMEKVVE
jgi:hypothetical protein